MHTNCDLSIPDRDGAAQAHAAGLWAGDIG
jgi:hypothetical protein